MIATTLLFVVALPGPQGPSWHSLFDGESLAGWQQINGTATYRVEGGAIVGTTSEGSPNSFLCTERLYADFELELEVKVDDALNSGIQIRSNSFREYQDHRVHGYQVEVAASGNSGYVYDEARRAWLSTWREDSKAQAAFRKREWNHYRIVAIGPRIQTWVNGVPVESLVDHATRAGFIGLQVHSIPAGAGPHRVAWRNIRIQDLGTVRPEGVTVLLDESGDLSAWRSGKIGWKCEGGVLEVVPGAGNLRTEQEFQDFRLHLEFDVAQEPPTPTRGNSGIYIQGRYEVQILDSVRLETTRGGCGSIYQARKPDVNACRASGEWQSFDLEFRAPRWSEDGEKVENARIAVWHNGTLIHDDVEIPDKTGMGQAEGPSAGPIVLQDHGSAVRFRNIWIEPLEEGCGGIFARMAKLERVAGGFAFTEGPAADAQGDLYFSDVHGERIHRFEHASNKLTTYRENSGRANGLLVEPSGALLACEGGNRRLTRIVDGSATVLASSFEGKKLNSPNDLTRDARGGIYFTDPRYGDRSDLELDVEGVYYVSPSGELRRVLDELERPNGIMLSRDGQTLYVADNAAKTIRAYDVQADGGLTNGRVFARMDPNARGGGDGMTIDGEENLYCAGQGYIWVWSPSGTLRTKLLVPEQPTNCTFGGPDRRTLYITARTLLYRIALGERRR